MKLIFNIQTNIIHYEVRNSLFDILLPTESISVDFSYKNIVYPLDL